MNANRYVSAAGRRPRHGRRLSILACVLAASIAAKPAAAQAPIVGPLAVDPTTLEFAAVPNGIDCAPAAAVKGDPAQGPAVLLFKFAAGCAVPWHTHTPSETVILVGGALRFEMKGEAPVNMRSGAFVFLPSGHIHRASCSPPGDCLVYAMADGVFDVRWVDDEGNEITLEEALRRSEAF